MAAGPELSSLHVQASRVLGATDVSAPEPLAGGASRRLWAFDATTGDGTVPLVLLETLGTAEREWQVLRAAHAAGVPVAEPLWREGEDGLVMRRVTGETIPRRVFRDEALAPAREHLLEDLATALAALHRAPLDDVPAVAPSGPAGAAGQLDTLAELLHGFVEPHPALELGIRWLRSRLPDEAPPALVHGDFRMGNVMVGPAGLSAVLDWELVHAGDPAEDLGWLCVRSWRFGRDDQPAGGLGTRRQLLDAYADAGGERIDPERLRFWETLGNLKWGIYCLLQADRHLSGGQRSLEHAAIGRRTCEAEWDLLAMIP